MRARAAVLLLGMPVLVACQGARRDSRTALASSAALQRLDGARFMWVEAECNDGPLDLAAVGFDRELTLGVGGADLALTFDTDIASQACFSTAVWLAKPASEGGLWRFEPRALVTLPPDQKCGAIESEPTDGVLHMSGEVLEIALHRSPWCRGFDARFVYRRVEPKRLDARQVVTRYAAAFAAGDAAAVAALFVDAGALVEPFTKTDDGNYKRHEGRAAVRAWYASAFASTPWLALRLISIEPGVAVGQLSAGWEYMDAHLAEPLRGRNLFVIAGGEIYETELQLIDDPKPVADPPEARAATQTRPQRPADPTRGPR
jgi:SnoaL-like protein